MAAKTPLKALVDYFNTGSETSLESASTVGGVPSKRSLPAFRDEIKALDDTVPVAAYGGLTEKRYLATLAAEATGDTLLPL